MSNEPYLILHRVRGEPAFDVAIQIPCPVCEPIRQGLDDGSSGHCHECENGFWWVIPTSGHRAYPYWFASISKMTLTYYDPDYKEAINQGPPDDWPDHYAINNAPIKHEPRHSELLNQLGLSKASKLVRRI